MSLHVSVTQGEQKPPVGKKMEREKVLWNNLWSSTVVESLGFPCLACKTGTFLNCCLSTFWWVIKTFWLVFQKTTGGFLTGNRNVKSILWKTLSIVWSYWKPCHFKNMEKLGGGQWNLRENVVYMNFRESLFLCVTIS